MRTRICFPGACANVFWQLGVVKAIQRTYMIPSTEDDTVKSNNLCDSHVYGVSAGAISAVFLVCCVDIDRAVERAFQLSDIFGLSSRTFGVIGIWGYIVRIWLNEVLPHDCAQLCNNKCTIFLQSVTPSHPSKIMSATPISSFQSKDDLIDAILASCHVPILLDLAPFAQFRNKWYVDGQLLCDPILALPHIQTFHRASIHVFRYDDDHAYMNFVRKMKFMQFRDKSTAFQMIRYGYMYYNNEKTYTSDI